jgi:hypothetical protein
MSCINCTTRVRQPRLTVELTPGYPEDVKVPLLALPDATYDALPAVLMAGGHT